MAAITVVQPIDEQYGVESVVLRVIAPVTDPLSTTTSSGAQVTGSNMNNGMN